MGSIKIWDSLPLTSQATEAEASPVPPLDSSTLPPPADALAFAVVLLAPLMLQGCFNSLPGGVKSKSGRGDTKRDEGQKEFLSLNLNIPGQHST